MTPSINSYLIPEQAGSINVLKSSLTNLFTAHPSATASATTLILQPSFSTKLLITLPEDQARAANHARIFMNGWRLGMVSTYLGGIISIAKFMSSISRTQLLPAARVLDGTDPCSNFTTEQQGFVETLNVIQQTCCRLSKDSGSYLLTMQNLNDKLSGLSQLIDDDLTNLTAAVGEVKTDAKIEALLEQQKELQKEFADNNDKIADGAVSKIEPSIEFGFSFAKEFLEGVEPGGIAGAALGISGEVKQIKEFNEETQALRDEQSKLGNKIVTLVEEITQDKAELLELTLMTAQSHIFSIQIHNLIDCGTSILDQLQNWSIQLDLLSDKANQGQEEKANQGQEEKTNYFVKQVQDGLVFWEDLHTTTVRYQKIMSLPGQVT